MSTQHKPDTEQATNCTRRQALKLAAGATGAATVGYGADRADLQLVDDAQAVPPALIAGLALGTIATGTAWYLTDGQSRSAESAAKDAAKTDLQNDLYEIALKRKNENASRFLSTEDIANLSKDTGYEEGKIAAFGPLSGGKTEQQVVDAAHQAATDYFKIPKKNLLDQWESSVYEFRSYYMEVNNQGFDMGDFATLDDWNSYNNYISDLTLKDRTHTFGDGEDYGYTALEIFNDQGRTDTNVSEPGDYTSEWSPISKSGSFDNVDREVKVVSGPSNISYLKFTEWNNIWNKLDTIESEVKSGLSTWVNTVYGNLQAGEITISEVASNLDLAKRALEEEELPRAKADLLALNLPVDLDREVTLSYSREGVEWTASGFFAALGESAPTWTVGETYDPSNSGTPKVVIATDGSSQSGVWTDYNAPMDGGIVQFTREPLPGLVYQIQTIEGESATAKPGNFSENTTNGTWEADVSGQLENPITEVDSVAVYPQTSEDYQVIISEPFTIEQIVDQSTGENVQDATTERPKTPQNDSNYLTKEEWEQLQQNREDQYDELLKLFKDVSGGGGGGLFNFGGGLPSLPGLGVVESAIVVALGFAGLNALSS